MVYITGDLHGHVDIWKLQEENLERHNIQLTQGDYLIITGDFGLPFDPQQLMDHDAFLHSSSTENLEYINRYGKWITWLSKQPYTVLFVDGNHDNHEFWGNYDSIPKTEMFGGLVQVHPHASNVIHLLRGEVYNIEGKKYFTFGGAASIDKLDRCAFYDWWPGEETNVAETNYALDNLEKHNFKVDYIITHTMPMGRIQRVPKYSFNPFPCTVACFLNEIISRTAYDKWFCGHFHIDACIPGDRLFILYNSIHALPEFDSILETGEF